MNKLESKGIGTLVVLAIAFAAFYVLIPQFQSSGNGKHVIVTVEWTPDRTGCPVREGGLLTDVVSIWVTVGHDVGKVERHCESPYARNEYARVGTVVEVRAEQFFGEKLKCTITQIGATPVTKEKHGPSEVACRHVVV